MDNGGTWNLIHDNLGGTLRHYDWDVPTAVTGQAFIKITRGASTSQNMEPFSIIGIPQNINVDWACDDALHLSWNEVFGATSYEVMMLGEKYMEPIGTTSITSFIVENISSSSEYWFTVRAIGENNTQGRRAIAINKSPGTFDCYAVDAKLESVPSADWGIFQSC
nr:fibronectin type III domain-containing protein [Bacteroidota bacterium]